MVSLFLIRNAPIARFSSTLRLEKIILPSGTWQSPLATILCAGSPAMGSPKNEMEPDAGRSNPEIVRSVVVLPAPLPPMRVTIAPFGTSREIPERALMAPYETRRSESESIAQWWAREDWWSSPR